MGGILLVISAAVIIVVTVLLSNTIDNRLETVQQVIFQNHKLKVDELGKVKTSLISTDISSEVYVQIWGLDGELQSSFAVPKNFADKPFNPDALHISRPA